MSNKCSCVEGQWQCDNCTAELHAKIKSTLTPQQLAYDDFMESGGRCDEEDDE